MKLKEEFNKKVKELKENCPHEELTEPQEIYWAPGHTSGYKSRFCERCNKQMDPNPWKERVVIEDGRKETKK